MSRTDPQQSTPQFQTAEYKPEPGSGFCRSCNQPVGDRYYRVSGAMTCANCAEKLSESAPKDSAKAFSRGMMFGAGAAILGLILYSVVGIVTGLQIGYVSLAVGYIVGHAMMKGSYGIGSRRYQIAAAALTYAAVSISAVPISIAQMAKTQSGATAKQDTSAGTQETKTSDERVSKMGVVAALGFLTLLGLASPFLELAEPLSGIIGLVILFVGMRIAWRITAGAKVEIRGPYRTADEKPV